MSKYVLFLCGGKWQLPWLLFLKSKGHKILLVDPNDDCVCRKHAAMFLKHDVLNTNQIISHVLQLNITIEFVTSDQTDVSTLPVAIISEALNLKSNPVSVVERFSNKEVSRNFIMNKGLGHIPEFLVVDKLSSLCDFIVAHGNCILKPVDSQSSRGLHLLSTDSTMNTIIFAFHDSLRHSNKGKVIIEKFINGSEITIEGVCFNNQHYILTGSNKTHFRNGIASNLIYPLKLSSALQEELFSFHNKLVQDMGLRIGITHAEYMVDESRNEFYLIEVACRGGGTLIPSHIVPSVTGIDLYQIYYDGLVSSNFKAFDTPGDITYTTLHFFEFPSKGRVSAIKGLSTCKNFDFVVSMELEFKAGDVLGSAVDDRSRQGYVIIKGHSPDDVKVGIDKIYNELCIEYEPSI